MRETGYLRSCIASSPACATADNGMAAPSHSSVLPAPARLTLDRDLSLDQLRALAAILMVANHVGYKLLSEAATQLPVISGLLFISSFAPVLFFYATGFGIGMQTDKAGRSAWWAHPTTQKCLLLLLADFYLRGASPAAVIGMDFFGFIALSTAAVYLLGKSPHPLALAIAGALLFFCLRFLPLNWLDQLPDFFTGRQSTPGVSYPISPWIIFPVLGYAASKARLPRSKYFLLLAAGITAFLVAFIMHEKDMVLHRWATMSAAYFVASIAMIGLSHGVLGIISRVPQASNLMPQLNGTESFLIVPIHYFSISLMPAISVASTALVYYLVYALAVSMVTFYLSRRITELFKTRGNGHPLSWPIFVAACFAIELLRLADQNGSESRFENVLALVALLLVGFKLHNSKPQQASAAQQSPQLNSR